MKIHIQIVAILNIVGGALSLLLGLFVCLMFVLAGSVFASFGMPNGALHLMGIFLPVALIIGGFCAALSLPNIIVGWALYNGKTWARPWTLVLAVFWLFAFPLGTLIGFYSFWALLYQPEPGLPSPDQPFTPNMLQ